MPVQLKESSRLADALKLVEAGSVTADFHSDGAMKFAGSGNLWPAIWQAFEARMIVPDGEWEAGTKIILTDIGRAALAQVSI